jgi:peptide deformylase
VSRRPKIRIRYVDQDWNPVDEQYEGIPARIIQHEYDHIEGTIFVDRISPLRKIFLKKKLADITNGNIKPGYRMIFPGKKANRRQVNK